MYQPATQRFATVIILLNIGWWSSFAVAAEIQSATQRLYTANCADCHGDSGSSSDTQGDFPGIPDFQDLKWQLSRTNVNLRASIAMGMGDEMPAFEGDLSDEEIEALVKLIRSFSPQYEVKADSLANSKREQLPPGESFEARLEVLEIRWSKLLEEFKVAREAARGL